MGRALKFARPTPGKRRQCSFLVGPSAFGQIKGIYKKPALENCLANAILNKTMSPLSLLKVKILRENYVIRLSRVEKKCLFCLQSI